MQAFERTTLPAAVGPASSVGTAEAEDSALLFVHPVSNELLHTVGSTCSLCTSDSGAQIGNASPEPSPAVRTSPIFLRHGRDDMLRRALRRAPHPEKGFFARKAPSASTLRWARCRAAHLAKVTPAPLRQDFCERSAQSQTPIPPRLPLVKIVSLVKIVEVLLLLWRRHLAI